MKFYVKLINHSKIYPTENIIRAVFKGAELSFSDDGAKNTITSIMENDKFITIIDFDGTIYRGEAYFDMANPLLKKPESVLKLSFADAARKIFDFELPWGILTGIRPAKMVCDLRAEGYSDSEIKNIFKINLLVPDKKIKLMFQAAEYEELVKSTLSEKDISLYIGIPFCPTRCAYCSFISKTYKNPDILNDYINALEKEIRIAGQIISEKDFRVKTIYIGGGTPTSLSPELLSSMLSCLHRSINLAGLTEFSVECGRPDTVTNEKLEVLKRFNVDRISINPQTLKDETLKAIGRAHDSEMFWKAYDMARKYGFKVINTDLIAGLPGEDLKDFQNSLDKIIGMKPENITIHSLALKRAARLIDSKNELITAKSCAEEMIDYAYLTLNKNGYIPYYLYRQKNTIENLENTGYGLPGTHCVYNIAVMQEIQPIMALGGGGVSKILKDGKTLRLRNPKDGDEYIKNIEDVTEKKLAFYK